MDFNKLLENPELIHQYIAPNLLNHTIYICGSIAEGFGNSKSDIDVYVIAEELPLLDSVEGRLIFHEKYKIHNIQLDMSRIDIEYWTWQEVMRLQRILEDYKISGDKLKLTEEEIDYLHRLKFAKPLYNEKLFLKLISDTRFDQFDRGLVIAHINIYSGLIEDIEGCLVDGDHYTALAACKLLLDRAIDAYLCSRGETNARPKWRLRKLIRAFSGESDVFQKYMKYQYLTDLRPETIRKHVEEVLLFCQQVVIEAQEVLEVKLDEV